MGKEKVLEIEITKIDDYWNAITVKKIKEDFKSNDLFEWITIGENYVCNYKIFINRVYPNTPFIAGNETTFIFKDIVDKINEKYGIPYRWRAKENEEYFTIKDDGHINRYVDIYCTDDDYKYNLGNYFRTYKEAEEVLKSKEWKEFWEKVREGGIGEDE